MKMASAIIEINSCKNNCVFCNPFAKKRHLSEEEVKNLEYYFLGQAMELSKSGYRALEISGGDPIEYRSIDKLIALLKKDLKFKYVVLSTHGRDLSDVGLVRRLKKAGLDELRIPIYGSSAKIHDAVTNKRGSFFETTTGIKNVLKYAPKIKMTLRTLLLKLNYRDIVNIFKFSEKYSSSFMISIPCSGRLVPLKRFAVDFKIARPYLLSLLKTAEASKSELSVHDIPYCVFGEFHENILMTGAPNMAKCYCVPKPYRTKKHNLPSYRVKEKMKMCGKCRAVNICDGFYRDYIETFKPNYLRPL